MHCITCAGVSLQPIKINKINRAGYQCHNCSFIFLWPQPSAIEIKDIYDDSYYRSWGILTGEEKPETARLKKATGLRCLKRVKLHEDSGKLLDIGSAFGYFMEVAEMHGFEAHGVELSHFSNALARKKFGSRVFEGRLEDAKFADESFDVVTMFDLIEHVPDPLQFMKEVRRIVKPSGIVAITTPDTGSLSSKILGLSGWFHWKFEHLGYFNRKSIGELARRTGFVMVEKKRAVKSMSFQYLFDQFKMFPHPIFSPIMRLLSKIIPRSLKHKTFPISGGEMLVILKAE